MHPEVPVIEIGSPAPLADSDRPALVLEMFVRPALEAHVVLADGTDDVVAPLLPADGDPAVAAGLAELEDDLFRWIFAVTKIGIGTILAEVAVSVDAAKDVLARRTVDSVRIAAASIVPFILVVVAVVVAVFGSMIGKDEFVAARAGNQRRLLRHSVEALEFDPVFVGSILHQQGFLYEIDR